jgi:DNA-directed RNA polymerase subunit RPC12/RpoP
MKNRGQKMATEKRLIDANKPIKETESIIHFRMCHHMPTEDYESFLNYLKKQPTVDVVEVVHGRWELYPSDRNIRCTNCKMEFLLAHMSYTRNYCPNCGAKMDGDGNG